MYLIIYQNDYFDFFYAFLMIAELYLIVIWGLSLIFTNIKMNDYLKLFVLIIFFIIGMLPSIIFTFIALTGSFQP